MGRIKTSPIKRKTFELMEKYGNRFTDNYEKNKETVNSLIVTSSKKVRNSITGYVTRLVKKAHEPKKRHVSSAENLDEYYK